MALCNGSVYLHDNLANSFMDFLFEWGFDINGTDSLQRTGLMEACRLERTSLVSLFLKRGANPDLTDALKNSALHYACMKTQLASLKLILNSSNKSINVLNSQQATPLHTWVQHSTSWVGVEVLLEHGADAQLAFKNGLLYLLMSKNSMEAVETLIQKHGARMGVVASDGSTALSGFLVSNSSNIQNLHKIFRYGGMLSEDQSN